MDEYFDCNVWRETLSRFHAIDIAGSKYSKIRKIEVKMESTHTAYVLTEQNPPENGKINMNDNNQSFKSRKNPIHFMPLRRHNRASVIFLTVCSKNKKKIFARNIVHDLLIDSWSKATFWAVGKYIIMPDHIHLFCVNADSKHPDLKPWIKYWKSLVSNNWPYPEEQPIWQNDFWDRQLRNNEHYERKWLYIRNNPVNHGLVASPDDWPFKGQLDVLF